MNHTEPIIFPPYRLVAEFADNSRLLFDGLTEQQAREHIDAAQAQHGDLVWLDGVTDQNYTGGVYHKLLPPPAVFPFPLLDLSDIDTTNPDALRQALLDPFEEDGVPE